MVRAYPGTDGRLAMVLALAARGQIQTQPMTSPVAVLGTVRVNRRRAMKSWARRSRSRRFSATLIRCGQLAPANPGVARMCPMLAVHAAQSALLCRGPSGSSRNSPVASPSGTVKSAGTNG